MRVIVTGGRDFDDEFSANRVFDALLHQKHDLTIVHGGAPGADMLAHRWAQRHGVREEIFPADWEAYGKKAGPIRNTAMIKSVRAIPYSKVIAFPGGGGTADCVRKAKSAGILVLEVTPARQVLRVVSASEADGVVTLSEREQRIAETRCHADDDDFCDWEGCPQLRDEEPRRSGRYCPLDQPDTEREGE